MARARVGVSCLCAFVDYELRARFICVIEAFCLSTFCVDEVVMWWRSRRRAWTDRGPSSSCHRRSLLCVFLILSSNLVCTSSTAALSPAASIAAVKPEAPPSPSPVPPSPIRPTSDVYHVVTVYENEAWTMKSGWARPKWEGLRQWTYHDGGLTLAPDHLQLPDGWEWVTDWKVVRQRGTDREGWRYARGFRVFSGQYSGSSRPGWGFKARRRRWVRMMRVRPVTPPSPPTPTATPEGATDGPTTAGAGAAAAVVAGPTGQTQASVSPSVLEETMQLRELLFIAEGGMEADLNTELLAAEALGYEPTLVPKAKPPAPRARVRQWLREEFTFKGFGLSVTKSLIARDVGLGFGIPLTPNFQWWERSDALPTINSNVGVFYPFCVAGWISISYPADLLLSTLTQLWTLKPRSPRSLRTSRASVERVGVSISCRYTPAMGLFFRLTPWFFIMPGIPIIARFLAWLAMSVLQQLESFEDYVLHRTNKAPQPISAKRVKAWLSKKTTGVGYTMGMTRSGVGGSILFALSPFFLGLRPKRRQHLADASRRLSKQETTEGVDALPGGLAVSVLSSEQAVNHSSDMEPVTAETGELEGEEERLADATGVRQSVSI